MMEGNRNTSDLVIVAGKSWIAPSMQKEKSKVLSNTEKGKSNMQKVVSTVDSMPIASTSKPAIMAASNTNRPLDLQKRQLPIKKLVKVPKLKKNIKEGISRSTKVQKGQHSTLDHLDSTKSYTFLDLSKSMTVLKSFSVTNEEFLSILEDVDSEASSVYHQKEKASQETSKDDLELSDAPIDSCKSSSLNFKQEKECQTVYEGRKLESCSNHQADEQASSVNDDFDGSEFMEDFDSSISSPMSDEYLEPSFDFESENVVQGLQLKNNSNSKIGSGVQKQKKSSQHQKSVHHFCFRKTLPLQKLAASSAMLSHIPAKYYKYSHLSEDNFKLNDIEISEDKRLSDIASKILATVENEKEIKEDTYTKLQGVVNTIFEKREQNLTSFNSRVFGHKIVLKNDISRFYNMAGPPKFYLPSNTITNILAPEYKISRQPQKDVTSNPNSQHPLCNKNIDLQKERLAEHFKELNIQSDPSNGFGPDEKIATDESETNMDENLGKITPRQCMSSMSLRSTAKSSGEVFQRSASVNDIWKVSIDPKLFDDAAQKKETMSPEHCARSNAVGWPVVVDIVFEISKCSKAIQLHSKDASLYYSRAELLEQRGDVILALEDYKTANKLQPTNKKALRKIAFYHYSVGVWASALGEFTELLHYEPRDAEVLFYRAKTNAKLGYVAAAVSDFSMCIHHSPEHFMAYFYRGCLLRRTCARQALRDFGVSLLINSSIENISTYLHRGLLYYTNRNLEEAKLDFEAAVRLNCKLAHIHVNLGMIELETGFYPRAIGRFNIALKVDPTYIRALLCRAEAYERSGKIDFAIRDYTRSIHAHPFNMDYKISRGRLLLKGGFLQLASFHIRQCAEMNTLKSVSFNQHAIVENFLKNFDKAEGLLKASSNCEPETFALLAKTQMKRKNFQEAITSFEKAIELIISLYEEELPKKCAPIYFLIGECHVKLKNSNEALVSFNNAVLADPHYAEAYYRRGLVKMRLSSHNAVDDFNVALVQKPAFYQAYLARASYYGANKRYSKAIMNCNEALKLEERSVRALVCRGVMKCHIKAYTFAIDDLTRAIGISPDCLLAYFNRAIVFHQKKFYFKALTDYSVVLMYGKDSQFYLKAILNRGLLYYEINDFHNALHDFEVLLEVEANNADIYYSLAVCYHRLNRQQDAIRYYTSALRVNPKFYYAYLGRANSCANSAEEISLKKRDCIRSLHLNPLFAPALICLAKSLQSEGKFAKAWNLCTRSLQISPSFTAALEVRALISLTMQNTFGAQLDLNKAIQLKRTATALNNRGFISELLGDQVNAMRDYHKAIAADHHLTLASYNVANLYLLHKQFAQAILFYNKAIGENPFDGCALVNNGVAKMMTKDVKGAVKDFQTAEPLNGTTWQTHFNRGTVHHKCGKYALAEFDYTTALEANQLDALAFKRRADVRGKLGHKTSSLNDYRHALVLMTS